MSSADPVSLRVDLSDVQAAVRSIPRSAYFWMRAYLFELSKTHRQTWLREKGTKFGRVSSSERGIKVSRINEGGDPPTDNEVSYQVRPREVRQPSIAAAQTALPKLRADIFTGNKILPVHEFGIDISSRKWMPIPVRTRPGNIHRWRERNPTKTLITLPSKRGNDSRLVYEVQLRRARGRQRRDFIGPAPVREKLRLRFVLRRSVDMKPTLRLYDSWENIQRGVGAELFERYASRLMGDLAKARGSLEGRLRLAAGPIDS